jgi:hypothetical protein
MMGANEGVRFLVIFGSLHCCDEDSVKVSFSAERICKLISKIRSFLAELDYEATCLLTRREQQLPG